MRADDWPGDRDPVQLLCLAGFPQAVEAGIRVAHLGSSSVRYEVGLFARARASRLLPGILCMSMSTDRRAGLCLCPSPCVRHCSHCCVQSRLVNSKNDSFLRMPIKGLI
jgi:hypothetical protein